MPLANNDTYPFYGYDEYEETDDSIIFIDYEFTTEKVTDRPTPVYEPRRLGE
jgi:hypothetical protein